MRYLFVAMVAGWLAAIPHAAVAAGSCTAGSSLEVSAATCEETDDQTLAETISTAPTGTVYKTQVQCTNDVTAAGACVNPLLCPAPPGAFRYDVLRSTDGGATFTKVSEVCLTNPPPVQPEVTTELVTQQFKAIGWGESPLVVQPPGGRTLVNLETNFYTDNVGPRVQPVTLLGQQVDIEATPTTWTWHHGDGTSQTTSTPGTAYPDLSVTHTYLRAGAALAPSVDTTYAGRYRVNGGDWIAIPDTVTVGGTPGQLEVVTAKPQLVAGD